jgi:hypothetical protein
MQKIECLRINIALELQEEASNLKWMLRHLAKTDRREYQTTSHENQANVRYHCKEDLGKVAAKSCSGA